MYCIIIGLLHIWIALDHHKDSDQVTDLTKRELSHPWFCNVYVKRCENLHLL